jgi:hypothetical protein
LAILSLALAAPAHARPVIVTLTGTTSAPSDGSGTATINCARGNTAINVHLENLEAGRYGVTLRGNGQEPLSVGFVRVNQAGNGNAHFNFKNCPFGRYGELVIMRGRAEVLRGGIPASGDVR